MKLTLFLIALLLVAGAAVWFGRTSSGPAPVLPQSAAASGGTAKEDAKLESEAAGRKSASDPAAKPAAAQPAATTSTPAPPQPVDPSVIATGLDGGMPSEAAGGDMSAFEAKYAGASKDELKANYDALQVLYQENKDGRVEDKERVLAPEALSELEREIAWLKDKAFGGG